VVLGAVLGLLSSASLHTHGCSLSLKLHITLLERLVLRKTAPLRTCSRFDEAFVFLYLWLLASR
jgi:hypothetical protein